MKDIMANKSSAWEQGVPNFEFDPRVSVSLQPELFSISKPFDDLKDDILQKFAGQKVSLQQLFWEHSPGTCYIKRNYKDAVIELEMAGRISAIPPLEERPKRKGSPTLADRVEIVFP
jgi:hypothetical protein